LIDAFQDVEERAAFLRDCHIDPEDVVNLRVTIHPLKRPRVYLTVWADADLSQAQFPEGYVWAVYKRKRKHD
jgi:hypothetical protein